MISDPNPTDFPEVEKFCEWLYSDESTATLHSFEQLREAFNIGLTACHSRDGSIGAELLSRRAQADRLFAILDKLCDLKDEIESDARHKAKAADVRINAPLALIQQALSAQLQVIDALLAIQQRPAASFEQDRSPQEKAAREALECLETIRTERVAAAGLAKEASAISKTRVRLDRALGGAALKRATEGTVQP